MKRTIEVEAKKVEQAISEGLRILNVSQEDAEIKVISAGGLFKKAKVEITAGEDDIAETIAENSVVKNEEKTDKVVAKAVEPKKADNKKEKIATQDIKSDKTAKATQESAKVEPIKQQEKQSSEQKPKKEFTKDRQHRERKRESVAITAEVQARAEDFLKGLLDKMGIEATLVSDTQDGLSIDIQTTDSLIIGHHGETLDALQYLTSLVVNGESKGYSQVNLDALSYRNKRTEILKKIANEQANKCLKEGRKVYLKPMSSAERKVVHAFLTENLDVVTKSEG